MRNITSPTFDCVAVLVTGIFCLLYGAFTLLQADNKAFGCIVVFVGIANLINAKRVFKKIRKESS